MLLPVFALLLPVFALIPEGKGASENFFSPGMMFRIVYILQFG
jgi:hypothetical protein